MARPPDAVRFTRSAREDLITIWMHGATTWGEAQADRYQQNLFERCAQLASGQLRPRAIPELSGIGHSRCGSHHIFILENTAPLIVLAVLHERMDLMARLKERLE